MFVCCNTIDKHYKIDGIGRMFNALLYHANSLTTLSLILCDADTRVSGVGSANTFRDLPLLKELTVSRLFPLGRPTHDAPRGCTAFFDLLPSNLTSLTVVVGLYRIHGKLTKLRGFF